MNNPHHHRSGPGACRHAARTDYGEQEANRYQAAVCVTDVDGRAVSAVLNTVNGDSFTAFAATEAARRVMGGEVRPGFQTPAVMFGHSFAETIADTRITFIDGVCMDACPLPAT